MEIKECRKETQKHINNVRNILNKWSKELMQRGKLHDKSKLESPEIEIFCEYTPKLANSTYGSEEYKGFLKEMQVALNHHYRMNKHHPEYFKNGIQGMTLIDIMELLADWKSATLRHNDGDLIRSINFNQERFKYSDDLKQIFLNTAKLLYTYRIEFGCVDDREGMYLSDTIEGIHKQIDNDKQLNEDEKSILKYGYFNEFKDKDYHDEHFCIDNGFDCCWYKQNYFK
jgi:hypothetical protein